MKILILQEKLKEGLRIIENISPKSLTLPILNTILLNTEKNFLKLTATDLEVGVNWWSLCKIEQEGELTIPFSIFSNFINLLPNKQISIQKKENFLFIECENYKTQIKGFSSEEFPIIPNILKENFIEIEIIPFCQGLKQIIDIPIISQIKPEISGIYFSFQKDIIKIVATDSFRLSEKTFFLKNSSSEINNKEISFIIPQKTAKEIINIFNQKQGKIKIYFSPHQILFESQMIETTHPEIQLISQLIDGEYPSYQEIIPKKYDTYAILNKNEFLKQIKIASLFSGKINEIKFKINPKKSRIEFFSQNPNTGEHYSFLEGQIKGEPLEVSFNYRFLINGLVNIESSEIIFELNKEEGPAILKPVGDPSYLYVVMPIKAG